MPLVSVIIPTVRRPRLVLRAAQGVLAQTVSDLEVIVVIEGSNPETVEALAGVTDPRLRVVQNAVPLGAGPARNAGAALAHGQWLAFLDDDDEWLPDKLERQLAGAAGAHDVMVTCRCRVITAKGRYVWPRRLFDGRQTVDEYLFDRRSLLRGEAYLATSTILVPKALFSRAQFGTSHQHEDTTLFLRLTKELDCRILMLPEALVVVHTEQDPGSLSAVFSWREAIAWLDSMGALITRRAYSGFCLVTVVSQAVRARDYAAIWTLFIRAWKRGSPTPVQLVLFVTFWLVPTELRRQLRAWIAAGKTASAPGSRG